MEVVGNGVQLYTEAQQSNSAVEEACNATSRVHSSAGLPEAILRGMGKSGLLLDLRLSTAARLQGLCMRQKCWSLDHAAV